MQILVSSTSRHMRAHILCQFSLNPTIDVPSITKSIVNHVQTSLARQAYNLDNLGAYQAVALSARDDLLVGIV